MEPDPSVIARQNTEATTAIQSLLHRAGPAVGHLAVDETEHTDWSRELRDAAANLALAVFTKGEHDAAGGENVRRFTTIAAHAADGVILATTRAEGWYGRTLLPALAEWCASSGRGAVWRQKGGTLVTLDGRYPMLRPPSQRSVAAICEALSQEEWSCAPDAEGLTLTRSRTGRDVPMTVLLVVMVTLLLPLMALVGLVLVARRLSRGEWDIDPEVIQPWRSAEDRIELRVERATLSMRRAQAGRTRYEHRWSPDTLWMIYAEPRGAGDPDLALVERDRVRALTLTLRGELRQKVRAMRSPSLIAELVALQWSRR